METVELKPTNVGFMETLEEMISCSRSSADKRLKPHPEQSLNCPRCSSTNTKFCYYNNYSLSQPRYFCKTCRRYWTKGGALRNVPVGGGCRKNRRSIANKPETKPTLNGCSQIHPDLGTHGLSSSLSCFVMADGHDLVLPNTRTQQYCGYGNMSESELFEHKPFPFSSISSSLNGVGENVAGLQNSGSLLNHSMEGLNGYFNQQRIEGGRLFFPLEDHREAAKPNMFGGFDQKVVGQPSENSCYWNGFGETWPEFPNYFP